MAKVPCPHAPSKHDGHSEGSPEFRRCLERERVRIRGRRLLLELRMMSESPSWEASSDGPSFG